MDDFRVVALALVIIGTIAGLAHQQWARKQTDGDLIHIGRRQAEAFERIAVAPEAPQ